MRRLCVALVAMSMLPLPGCTGRSSSNPGVPSTAPSAVSSAGVPAKDALSIPVNVTTSPEPRPYTVPTTPATDRLDVIQPSSTVSAGDDEKDADWKLIRLWDGGRRLAIFSAFGCNEPGRFLVRETQQEIVIRVVYTDTNGLDCLSTYHKQINLSEPLGQRRLLHVVG